MTQSEKSTPRWILIVTALFALLEITVSIALCLAPESVLETVDLGARGVIYVVYMWAARQFALGFILGFAAIKRSAPMLTLAYIFFLVMFAGDFVIGLVQSETPLIISALVMGGIASVIIYRLNRKN